MRILYGKTFGLGNAVCAVPAIKALRLLGHDVEVLCGNLSDDFGTFEVMRSLMKQGIIDKINLNGTDGAETFDLAVMAIPFDGRWKNGIHYNAKEVWDERGRPEYSQVFGFSSWKKHEVLYQMENVERLGFVGQPPSINFMDRPVHSSKLIYLGLGYKKDDAGYWKAKHWGNENYVLFLETLFKNNSDVCVVTTGDIADRQLSITPIMERVGNSRFYCAPGGLVESFNEVGRAGMYFGNDTGMMHVAASFGMPTAGMFFLENSHVKSAPWCTSGFSIYDPKREIAPDMMAYEVLEILDSLKGKHSSWQS